VLHVNVEATFLQYLPAREVIYSRDVHGNGIPNGNGNPMGMGIKHVIGNGNGREWETTPMGMGINYLRCTGNLFPHILFLEAKGMLIYRIDTLLLRVGNRFKSD